MLAGIGPLLGGEAVGSFTDSPPGRAWRYRDGRSWFGDSTSTAAHGWGSTPPRPLTHLRAPVAVLTGRRTSSSGEMTLLAFLGRPDLRTFGDTTSGAASANANVPLRDGAMLIITAAYPRDRLGRRYPLRIAPDEFVSESGVAGQDAPLLRASAWLRRHPACAPRE
jgi:C-terminal processing protease CtpA/Prc